METLRNVGLRLSYPTYRAIREPFHGYAYKLIAAIIEP